MRKIHLCCGDIYLQGYENVDIDGYIINKEGSVATKQSKLGENLVAIDNLILLHGNPNTTTLDNYFKFTFEPDSSKRQRKNFIIDTPMNILYNWFRWEKDSIDEIIMVSGFEHFEHVEEVPHIVEQAYKVLKPGGVFKFDFPDIKKTVEDYWDSAPEYCMELVYCNHKNKYSMHNWGYTKKSIEKYFSVDNWSLEFKDVVVHDYPMTGVWATKVVL